MTISKVKIFGERNTGTNFTELFVKLNFPAVEVLHHPSMPNPQIADTFPKPFSRIVEERLVDDLRAREFAEHFGWKHARTDAKDLMSTPQFRETGFIFIVRNPFAWLTSMLRRPYSLFSAALLGEDPESRDMDAFLRAPILTVLRDNLDATVLNTPMQLWSLKVRSHVDCAKNLGTQGLLLRYEDIITDIQVAADAIAGFDLHRPANLKIPATSTKGDAATFQDYQNGVRTYRPGQDFSAKQLHIIREGLDQKLCADLGYPLE